MPKAVARQIEAWWYTLISERSSKPEEQSRFKLAPLTQAERMRVFDDASWVSVDNDGKSTVQPRGFQQARELLLEKLVETENFPLGAPKAWPANGSRSAKEEYLELLDDMDVFEIGNAIRQKSTLEVAAKNF